MNNKKQQGITLVTTLIMLIVMSVTAMMASKMSLFDTYIARNHKEKVMVYQQTATDLKLLADIERLHGPMVNREFDPESGIYISPEAPASGDVVEVITDIGFDDEDYLYDCEGWSGRASSIGLGSRQCDLFDFQITRQKEGTGSFREKHHVGMGKEVPNPSKYSNL